MYFTELSRLVSSAFKPLREICRSIY